MIPLARLSAWFKRKNLKSHFTAISLATVAGIVKTDTDVQHLIFKFLKDHQEVGSMVVLIAGIIFRYSSSDKHLPPPPPPPPPPDGQNSILGNQETH